MRKSFIICSVFTSALFFGQHFCGTDHKEKEIDEEFPENKIKREEFDRKIREKGISEILKEYAFGGTNQLQTGFKEMNRGASMAYQGEIYNIPVVVHVIESNDESNRHLKLTDEEIKRWINDTK